MNISKVTEKYMFYKEGADYILNLGNIVKDEDTSTVLLFENVEDTSRLSVSSTCGCSTAERTVIDANSLSIKVRYKNCDGGFSKVLVGNNNGEKFKILIRGLCQ